MEGFFACECQPGFSGALSRAASAIVVLRTPTVYERSEGVKDRDRVIVAVQLHDSAGNTKVLASGLSVKLFATGGAESATLSTGCGGVAAPCHGAACAGSGGQAAATVVGGGAQGATICGPAAAGGWPPPIAAGCALGAAAAFAGRRAWQR